MEVVFKENVRMSKQFYSFTDIFSLSSALESGSYRPYQHIIADVLITVKYFPRNSLSNDNIFELIV